MRQTKRRKNGFTLVELLVSSAIGGAAILILGSSLNLLKAGSQKIESISNINELKQIVIGLISCQNTFASLPARPPCSNPGSYIDIVGRPGPGHPAGIPIISANGSQYGGWTLRALCSSAGIDIRASKIRTEFLGESNALTDWRGLSSPTPANLEKYVKDSTMGAANSRYSWAHPLSVVSSPGLLGLCTEYFTAPAASTTQCNNHQFIKQINLTDGSVVCKNIPQCSPPNALKFNGSDLVCSPELFNSIRDVVTNYKNNSIGPLNTHVNNTINTINSRATTIYNTLFQVFNPANDIVIQKWSRAECKDAGSMMCPDGWVMTSYEFRYDTPSSQSCSMNCRKIAP